MPIGPDPAAIELTGTQTVEIPLPALLSSES